MDMKQLEIFVTACERGSFSQAAACMYMTQPNIRQIDPCLGARIGAAPPDSKRKGCTAHCL